MRARTPRRLAAVALSTAIVIATAGSAAAADPAPPSPAATQKPAQGTGALLQQVTALAGLGGVLKPVTDLLSGVLGGKSASDVSALAGKATEALDASKTATPAMIVPSTPAMPSTPAAPSTPAVPASPAAHAKPATPAVPAVPATPATPAKPATPAAPAAPATSVLSTRPSAPLGGPEEAAGPADVRAEAVSALRKSVDDLVKAATSTDAARVVPAANSVVSGLVGVVVATVLGAGLPVPDLPGLPEHPASAQPAAPPKLPA
ncbi:hypothetical protein ABZ734_03125 [Streptomyces sp. NPDC006660]|uniref:hypothetical protein n=1 Tax=Streptomyces sp. NPDC006660 TaxID=3156901 RepID=UPI003411DDD7